MVRHRHDQPFGAHGRDRQRRSQHQGRKHEAGARGHPAPPVSRMVKRSLGPDHELDREADADRENQKPEQQPQMFAADFLPGAGAELRAGDAADHQDQRQHGVDQMIGDRMQQGGEHHGDQGQHHRGADHGRGRHPQQIDHDRHQDEAAADAHHRADEADHEADDDDGDHRQVDLGALEAHLQRQSVDPAMAARAARGHRDAAPGPQDARAGLPRTSARRRWSAGRRRTARSSDRAGRASAAA